MGCPTPLIGTAQSTHKILPCYSPLSKICGKLAAYVMHTESLSAFYVMLKEQESALEEMATRLEECYVNAPLPVVPPCAKLPCVAFYPKDGAWYRAKVVRDMNVQFIDYGNVDAVPEIREIAPEFLEIPPFCYKCKLDGAKELAGVAGADAAFKELVADAELELQVLTWGMEVTVRLSKDGADIGALLKEKLAAPSTESQAAPTCHTAEEVVPAPVSADAVPAAPTCEGCTVTHVDGLDSFYVLPLARQAELEALGYRLQEVFASSSAAIVDNPNRETLYGALYSTDGLWYRARVEGAAAEGGLKVRFVDYGNVESVQSVATLDSEEFHSEPFCMECQLAGLEGAGGPSALEKFKELVLDAELQVETVVPGSKPVVRLFAADGTELVTQLPLRRGYTVSEVPLHQKVQVQVSHAESPTDFFVQLVEQLDALDTLTEQLLELPPGDGAMVDMSQPCMVFWSDENPYRATVLETSDSAAALVHFVDYGNCDTVEVSSIRHLPSSLVEVPLFAIHCTLDVPEGNLGEEATEELQRLAESEPTSSLLAEFLGERNGRYVVRLLDMGIDVLGKLLKGEDSGGDMSPSDAAQGPASKETPEAAPTSGTGDEGDAAAPTVVEAQDSGVSETVASADVESEGSGRVETVEEAKETAIGRGADIPEAKGDELRDEAVEEAEFEARGDKLDEKENSGEPAADAELPEEGADASLNDQGGVAEELLPLVVEEDALGEDQAGTTTAGDLAPEEVNEATAFEETRTAEDDSREDGATAMVPIEEPLQEAPVAAGALLEEERTTLEVPTTAEDDSSIDDATVKLPTEESCLDAPAGAAAPLGEEPATFEEDSYDEDVTVVIRTEEPVLELPAGAAPFEEQESEVKVETAVVAAPSRLEDESGVTSADGKVPEATADADLAPAGAPSVGGSTSELALEDAGPARGSAISSAPEATPLEAPAPEVESKTELAGGASLVVAEEVPADGSQSKGELDKLPVASESANVSSVPVDEAPACAEVPLELAKEHGNKTEPEQESDTATAEVESALALEGPDEGSPREACVPTPADRPVALSEKGEGSSSPQRVGANDSSAAGAVAPVVSGAIGAGGDAVGFKAEATVSPYPSRRRMPDECVVPGVCTDPELFASPSDEGD